MAIQFFTIFELPIHNFKCKKETISMVNKLEHDIDS